MQAGNWKSTITAREHTEHSNTAVSSRVAMLDSGKKVFEIDNSSNAAPRKRIFSNTEQPASVANTNCTVININTVNVSGLANILQAANNPDHKTLGSLKKDSNY